MAVAGFGFPQDSAAGLVAEALAEYPCVRDHWRTSRGLQASGSVPLRRGHFFIRHPYFTTNDYKYLQIWYNVYGKLRTVEVDVDKLKELRINAGLSQRELATKAGLTPGAVWQVEHRGSGSPATLKKLADILRVRPVDLLKEGH